MGIAPVRDKGNRLVPPVRGMTGRQGQGTVLLPPADGGFDRDITAMPSGTSLCLAAALILTLVPEGAQAARAGANRTGYAKQGEMAALKADPHFKGCARQVNRRYGKHGLPHRERVGYLQACLAHGGKL